MPCRCVSLHVSPPSLSHVGPRTKRFPFDEAQLIVFVIGVFVLWRSRLRTRHQALGPEECPLSWLVVRFTHKPLLSSLLCQVCGVRSKFTVSFSANAPSFQHHAPSGGTCAASDALGALVRVVPWALGCPAWPVRVCPSASTAPSWWLWSAGAPSVRGASVPTFSFVYKTVSAMLISLPSTFIFKKSFLQLRKHGFWGFGSHRLGTAPVSSLHWVLQRADLGGFGF